MNRITTALPLAICLTSALLLTACGSDSGSADVSASGTTVPPARSTTAAATSGSSDGAAAGADHGDHATHADDHAHAGHGDHAGGHGDHGDMASVKLGSKTEGDIHVEVAAMKKAVEFTVSEGDEMRPHPPAPGDNAHVMVLVSDAESRDRLPDAAITAQITGPGGVAVHNGPLYPMIGMGVGLHYGDNMQLARSGAYKATIVVGPPQIGRHPESVERYAKPVKLEVPFEWTAP